MKVGDFETTKYDSFFNQISRSNEIDGGVFDIVQVVKEVFKFIYESPYSKTLFSSPKSYKDVPILNNLTQKASIEQKEKNEKTCDDVFYEYLYTFKDKTNRNYFILLLKFILLFRECYDISKNKLKNEGEKMAVTNTISPEGLPDLCNEFYGEFMEPNKFFGIEEPDDKEEIIEIIQHFCIWLFKNEYTKSKLSLAS